MKRTIVVSISYRGMQKQTEACINALEAEVVAVVGCGDMSLARSLGLTRAMERTRERPDVDALLVVDDDMVFSREAAQRLVDRARERQHPVGGVYATADGRLAAAPYADGRWLAGFGFMALPVAPMSALEQTLPLLMNGKQPARAWCGSGLHPLRPNLWTIEDYWFCLHWGGVYLEPIGVGHLKTVPLYPGDETLQRIHEGLPLENEPPEGGLSPLTRKID